MVFVYAKSFEKLHLYYIQFSHIRHLPYNE